MTGLAPGTLERSAARDAALLAMLPHVAVRGWTIQALRHGLAARGEPVDTAAFLFQGTLDMIEAYLDFADRRMAAASAAVAPTRLSERVRALIALRLHQAESERPALRRATAVLALPMHAASSARAMARSVDAIWRTAGDQAADFSWYTKRAILAVVYGATLLHWLRADAGSDPENTETLAFLDRRLAGVAQLGKRQAQVTASLARLLPARLRENPPTRATAPAPLDSSPVVG